MAKDQCSSPDFNAERFVDNLLSKGATVSCDRSNAHFQGSLALPPDFDEAKFKRGQQFYHEHILGMFLAKLLGLITILAIPTIRQVLSFTQQSNIPRTAFRRYMSTIFHMDVWYRDNFIPGSNLWKSLENVRNRHDFASKSRIRSGCASITQLDMALTQFGFMGYVVTNSEEVGIHAPNAYGMESWIYLWRVIGHLMGIQPEFNICQHSVSETKAICRLLIEKEFKGNVEKQDSEFLSLSMALIEGMTVMQPFLKPDWLMLKILKLVCPNSEVRKNAENKLSRTQRCLHQISDWGIMTYQYRIIHYYHNFMMQLSLWLMLHFPFLAIFRFGWKDAYVRILDKGRTHFRPLEQSG